MPFLARVFSDQPEPLPVRPPAGWLARDALGTRDCILRCPIGLCPDVPSAAARAGAHLERA